MAWLSGGVNNSSGCMVGEIIYKSGLARWRERPFQNGVRSKNVDKKLGRERRRVVLKSDLAVVATRILTLP